MIFDTSALDQTHGFALFLRCWWMEARDVPASLRQSVTLLVYKLCTDMLFQPDWRLHFENSFVQSRGFYDMQIKVEEKGPLWSRWYEKYFSRSFHIICELTEYILQLVARKNSVSYIVAVAAHWTKSFKFTFSMAVHRGVLAKNYFWLVATQKKKNWRVPKPFLKHVS